MTWIDDLSTAWGREYPDLDVATLPPMVRLARLGVLVDGLQQEVVQDYGVTPGEYGVLAALRRSGPPYQLSPSMLNNRLRRSSGGITKMLKRLEAQNLVERTPDPKDGRGSVVSLTNEGIKLQDQIFRAFLTATQNLLDPLSTTKLKEVDRSLRSLLDCFDEELPE